MTTRLTPFVTALGLALTATVASAAMPACGEGPFSDNSQSAAPPSVTRDEVVALAIQSPPAAGEHSNGDTDAGALPHPVDRTVVVAQLRDGLAHGFHPASGNVD